MVSSVCFHDCNHYQDFQPLVIKGNWQVLACCLVLCHETTASHTCSQEQVSFGLWGLFSGWWHINRTKRHPVLLPWNFPQKKNNIKKVKPHLTSTKNLYVGGNFYELQIVHIMCGSIWNSIAYLTLYFAILSCFAGKMMKNACCNSNLYETYTFTTVKYEQFGPIFSTENRTWLFYHIFAP